MCGRGVSDAYSKEETPCKKKRESLGPIMFRKLTFYLGFHAGFEDVECKIKHSEDARNEVHVGEKRRLLVRLGTTI